MPYHDQPGLPPLFGFPWERGGSSETRGLVSSRRVTREVPGQRGHPAYSDTVLLVGDRYIVHHTGASRTDPLDAYAHKRVWVVRDDRTGNLVRGGFDTRREAVDYATSAINEERDKAERKTQAPPPGNEGLPAYRLSGGPERPDPHHQAYRVAVRWARTDDITDQEVWASGPEQAVAIHVGTICRIQGTVDYPVAVLVEPWPGSGRAPG